MDLVQNERHTKRIKEILYSTLAESGILEKIDRSLDRSLLKEVVRDQIKDIVSEMVSNGEIHFRPMVFRDNNDSPHIHIGLEVSVKDSHGWTNSRVF